MTIKETQQAEIVVDPKTLSPEQQVTDATQQEEDYQPKILAILDKIESNTSALLRREPLAGGSTLIQSSTHQNNTDSVSKKHQSNTQKVFISSSEAAQRPVSRQAEKGSESGRSHQARSKQAKHRITERVHERNNPLTSRNSDVVREVQASDHSQRTGDNESQQREGETQVVIAGGESKPQETDSQPSKAPDAGAKAGQQVESKGNRQASVTPALATTVQKKKQNPRHISPSALPSEESKPVPEQKQREIERSEPQASTQPVASTDSQPQDNAPDDKENVTASQQAQEEQKEKRERSGLLKTVGDVFKKATEEREELEAGDAATDAAGSAVGGSLWEAAKEVKEATDDVKNSSLGQKVLEKVAGKKADNNESGGQSQPKEALAKEPLRGPDRDDKGRFIKRTEANTPTNSPDSLADEKRLDTQASIEYPAKKANGNQSAPLGYLNSNAEHNKRNVQKDIKQSHDSHSFSTQRVSIQHQNNTEKGRDVSSQKQISELNERKASVTSANVVKEREQTRSNEAIADRLDEQYEQSQDQHKELIDTIEKKELTGETGGSFMDSAGELSDMFGGGDGKEKSGGKRRRGRGRKGRLGSLIDRFKGGKSAAGNASALKGAPTTRLGRVAQGVKNATGTLANSGVGKAAGGALKTVGSVASRAAAPVAALATGYFKYNEVKDREDLTGSQKAVQVGATTAGSLGGASAGAAMGAAMGSVVPIVGNVVGGLLGAAVGGWLGGKGGDVVGEAISGHMSGPEKVKEKGPDTDLVKTGESSIETASNDEKVTQSAQVRITQNQAAKESDTVTRHSEKLVTADSLRRQLPDIQATNKPKEGKHQNGQHNAAQPATFDEKKLGKVIAESLRSLPQSGVTASYTNTHYSVTNNQRKLAAEAIPTEFEDKTLVLMAHDRI